MVHFWKPAEAFSPYYFPATIDPKHADALTIPQSTRTIQETATRVSSPHPTTGMYPIFDGPEAEKLVPRASVP
jgi:hypothetical protein